MKFIHLALIAFFIELPSGATELSNIDNSIMFQTRMSQPIDAYPLRKKEGKVKKLPNGDIIYKGQEYTPIANAHTTK